MGLSDDLMRMKEKMEKAKTEKAQVEGRLQAVMERMEKDFGCKTVEEAEKRLSQLSKEADVLQSSLQAKVTELKEKYFAV